MLIAQPGMMGPLALRNRIIMGPMGTNYGTGDGFSTERDKLYYALRAQGGAAMIITEAMVVAANARNHRNSLCIHHDKFIPGLAAVVDAIHDGGALAVAQLNHRGGLLRRSVLGMEPVGPSDGINPATGEPVRGLSVAEIRAIQEDFLTSARRAWAAGYDAVELHAANGYLFQQFFTARINRRDDAYGGSLENRMRLLLETVALIRSEIPELPLMIRISATEYVEGGYSEAEIIALAQALERAGVIAIDLSGGSNESPALSRYCIQPPSFPRRFLEPYARPITEALGIPVIMAGRIIDPEDAEGVLQAGSAHYVAVCRALVADPYWTRKAFGRIATPIKKCISCNVCFERLTLEQDVACVANPLVGTEFEGLELAEPQLADRLPEAQRRRVLVLGAGVAGVEAARVAAARGHVVEVWEKADVAGGQLPLAIAGPDKADVAGIWSYRWPQLETLGVPVRFGVEATPARIRDFAPDLAIVATGARARHLPILDSAPCPTLHAWEVIREPSRIPRGSHVTIIGGGLVGLETADLLVGEAGCHVTLIEALPTVATGMARNNRFDLLERLERGGMKTLTGTFVEGFVGDQVMLRSGERRWNMPAGDVVIHAVGPVPNRDVLPVLEQAGVDYVLVGDCNRPSDFLDGIRDAWMTALAVERHPKARTHAAALAVP
ncbi:2,4-dienoyl-CoA reductase-like NADH-dependent reductase (Old Yellow Enzyme family) [Humitalea rosea]|uniref:2,4-dienoyl-CoA reductase-like NADH-dependent reductase (Old Yellow Enzyme family) n=2 Tax=Humitalea rosea TaxID=990373 RepID=A0A2W7IRH4_9PROT|nr:2,4-dienoyl-CoA reductase-like NADH-dependent reductase (Old Yellow Enzyme family) [Humitalea rosea]